MSGGRAPVAHLRAFGAAGRGPAFESAGQPGPRLLKLTPP